jgi:phosphoserine phosphatase
VEGQLRGIMKVEPYSKDVVITDLSRRLAIPLCEFAAVGDAAPDASLFKKVGLKLAYNPKDDIIVKASDFVLDGLEGILDFL